MPRKFDQDKMQRARAHPCRSQVMSTSKPRPESRVHTCNGQVARLWPSRDCIHAARRSRTHSCYGQAAAASMLRPGRGCIQAAAKRRVFPCCDQRFKRNYAAAKSRVHPRAARSQRIQAEAESRARPCCGQIAVTFMSRPGRECIHAATRSRMQPSCASEQAQQEDAWSIPEPRSLHSPPIFQDSTETHEASGNVLLDRSS